MRTLAWTVGEPLCRQVAFVADGSDWIWQEAAKHFTGRVQILDFFHVTQHRLLRSGHLRPFPDGHAAGWPDLSGRLLPLQRSLSSLRVRVSPAAIPLGRCPARRDRGHPHSCLEEVLAIARDAGVGRLGLYHVSRRYEDECILARVRDRCAKMKIPFPVSVALPGRVYDDLFAQAAWPGIGGSA